MSKIPKRHKSNQYPASKESSPRPYKDPVEQPVELPAELKDIILNLPPEKQKEVFGVAISVVKSGPIPDEKTLKAYNDINPIITEAIVSDFKEGRAHKREMEKLNAEQNLIELKEQAKYKRRGQLCGLAVALGFMIVGVIIALQVNAIAGSILAGGGVFISLAKAFIDGNLFSKASSEQKAQSSSEIGESSKSK